MGQRRVRVLNCEPLSEYTRDASSQSVPGEGSSGMPVVALLNGKLPPVRRDGRHRHNIAGVKIPDTGSCLQDPCDTLMSQDQIVRFSGTGPVDGIHVRGAGRHGDRFQNGSVGLRQCRCRRLFRDHRVPAVLQDKCFHSVLPRSSRWSVISVRIEVPFGNVRRIMPAISSV